MEKEKFRQKTSAITEIFSKRLNDEKMWHKKSVDNKKLFIENLLMATNFYNKLFAIDKSSDDKKTFYKIFSFFRDRKCLSL